MSKKSTNAEVERRVQKVFSLLLKGYSRREIVQYGTAAGWDVTVWMVDKYIRKANALIEEEVAAARQIEFNKSYMRLTQLYRKSVEENNPRMSLSVVRELNALLGLYPSEKHEIAVEAKGLTADEIIAILKEDGAGK